MKEWEDFDEGDGFRGRKLNKDKFCKRHKIGNGKYGSHEYDKTNHCIRCGKINPQNKNRIYE